MLLWVYMSEGRLFLAILVGKPFYVHSFKWIPRLVYCVANFSTSKEHCIKGALFET